MEHLLQCRRANLADLDILAELEGEIFTDAWTREQLLPELQSVPAHVLLLEDVSHTPIVVGYAIFWLVLDELQLHRIALRKEFRGQGWADFLWHELLKICQQSNISLVTLEVRESNLAARAFYKRHAFRQVGKRPRYYQDTGETAILLDCKIGNSVD